ncbi:MAG: hypothetical protein NC097_03870 [Clostridium sp.]|nr:hypothetical protein [Prevotella sp.]MCM1378151.1 hypothetical protein [Prevotella sp.]MCM1428915.1 hypothetical protein [Clostridium sp.]MCM1475294.1 hypothetical protein [Muribaculaceae bacterium]
MRTKISISAIAALSFLPMGVSAQSPVASSLPIFEDVVFYDGYQSKVIDADLEDGILRHSNSKYAKRLSDDVINSLGDNLSISIVMKPLCDNYDRMGDINIALVPKGAVSYEFDDVQRIAVGRFISPFMDMNASPNSVPYTFEVPDLSLILHDSALRAKYDFWMEFEFFGIPYAANTQIRGCTNRQDVYSASLSLISEGSFSSQELADSNLLVPIFVKKSEDYGNVNFNSYTEGACDAIGVPERTFTFSLPEDVEDSQVVLIMTNHGAEENGEEYERRVHFVYFDDDLKLTYTPGGENCNVYRHYNTQTNGIYGWGPWTTTDDEWEEFSNWCPGQAVPIRRIATGSLKAGEHKVKISVPDAAFVDNHGDFRPSLYFQGVKKGNLDMSGADMVSADTLQIEWQWNGSELSVAGDVAQLNIYAADGTLLYGRNNPTSAINLSDLTSQTIIAVAISPNGQTAFKKLTKAQ